MIPSASSSVLPGFDSQDSYAAVLPVLASSQEVEAVTLAAGAGAVASVVLEQLGVSSGSVSP